MEDTFDPTKNYPESAGEAFQTLAEFVRNWVPEDLRPKMVERALDFAKELKAATVAHQPLAPGLIDAVEQSPEWDSQIDLHIRRPLRPKTPGHRVWFAEVELDAHEEVEGSDQKAVAFVRLLGGLRRRDLRDAFYAHRALLVRPRTKKK